MNIIPMIKQPSKQENNIMSMQNNMAFYYSQFGQMGEMDDQAMLAFVMEMS